MNKSNLFEDVGEIHWAHSFIDDLYQRGVIKGKTAMSFAPVESITRAQFTVMLANALQLTPVSIVHQFSDVPSWAQDGIQAVFEEKISNGKSDSRFNPNAELTHAQVAKLMSTLLQQIESLN